MNLRLTATLNGETKDWLVELSPTGIGRSSKNAIPLSDATVSKEHAMLMYSDKQWSIRDLGSRNGTRVNGQDATQALPLKPGDWIEVGHVMVRVGDEAPESAELSNSAALGSSLRLRVSDVLQRPRSGSADQNRLVSLLAEAGQLLVLPRPMRETCEEVLRLVEKGLTASRMVVLLRDKPGSELVQMAARTKGGSVSAPLALSTKILSLVLDENTAVITSDATNDPRFMGQQSIIAAAIHSAMAVPLFDNKHVLGLLYVDTTNPMVQFGQEQLELLTILGNMAAVKITNARLLEADAARQRLAQELSTATRIQTQLLPPAPDDMAGWRCHARIETCYEVGGDLYDFHKRDDGTYVILVGDVSGKGMGAALYMSSILSSARVLYDVCDEPLPLIRRLNQIMQRSSDGRSFVTMFVAYLDPATGRLRYVNAGHPEPHLIAGEQLRTLEANGIPVGMMPDFPWTQGEISISQGETMVLVSDGIPEAQCGPEFYEFERLAAAVRKFAPLQSLDAMAESMIGDIDAFAQGEHRADDVTLVLMRRE